MYYCMCALNKDNGKQRNRHVSTSECVCLCVCSVLLQLSERKLIRSRLTTNGPLKEVVSPVAFDIKPFAPSVALYKNSPYVKNALLFGFQLLLMIRDLTNKSSDPYTNIIHPSVLIASHSPTSTTKSFYRFLIVRTYKYTYIHTHTLAYSEFAGFCFYLILHK